jgi:hypothetical protein
MRRLPESNQALVVRADFSDDAAWATVCSIIRAPVDGFFAYVDFVDDPAFDGVTVDQLVELGRDVSRSFLIVADATTMTDAERSLLIIDVFEEPGTTFRAIPSQIQGIENNLSIANMDFREFAESADADGVFRGFPDA